MQQHNKSDEMPPEDVEMLRKNVVYLNERFEKLVKSTDEYCKAGSVLGEKAKQLIEELNNYGGVDGVKDPRTKKIVDVFRQIEKMKENLHKRTEMLLTTPMQSYQDQTIKPTLSCEDELRRARKKKDEAYSKLKRLGNHYKAKQAEEKYTELQSQYEISNFKYVAQLKEIEEKKWFNINNWLMSYLFVNLSFFRQGYKFLVDLEDEMRQDTKTIFKEETQKEEEFSKFKIDKLKELQKSTPRSDKEKQGYLQSKGKQIWFVVMDGFASFFKTWRDNLPSKSLDLVTCTVKVIPNKQHVFELISPEETYSLKARSQEDMDEWVAVIRHGIASQLESHKKMKKDSRNSDNSLLSQIQKLSEGNTVCADCGTKDPDWASINLGVIICYECSGVHRSLGTHISKVRSLTLDKWEPQIFQLMKFIGNKNANDIFEANLPSPAMKLLPDADRNQRELYISQKYKEKKFVPSTDDSLETLSRKIYITAMSNKPDEITVPTILRLLALGAQINWVNPEQNSTTSLHYFSALGNLVGLELLLQNGAGLSLTDIRGWTALHYAAFNDKPGCARLLLNRGAVIDARDTEGHTPLDIATIHSCSGVKHLLEQQTAAEDEETAVSASPT